MTDLKDNKSKKILPSIRCCKVCEETKPIDSFGSNRNPLYSNSRRHTCIECERIATNNRNKRNYFLRKQKEKNNREDMQVYKKVTLSFNGKHRIITYSDENELAEKEKMEPTEQEIKEYNIWAKKKWAKIAREEKKYRTKYLIDKAFEDSMKKILGPDPELFETGKKVRVVRKKPQNDEMIEIDHVSENEEKEQQMVVETLDDSNF